MRLLIVEDELRIAEILKAALKRAGFTSDMAPGCAEALRALATFHYDAAILDLGLPDGDGLTLLTKLRAEKQLLPVLVLTARDTVEQRVLGLDAGADDYLIKPFAVVEVIARIKALLRRPSGALGAVLEAGNLAFDTLGRSVSVNAQPVTLPRRELGILELLMRRLGRVVPKAVLEEKLYGIDDELGSNAISVHIHYLRRRLEEAGATSEIHTVRGVGYLLLEKML